MYHLLIQHIRSVLKLRGSRHSYRISRGKKKFMTAPNEGRWVEGGENCSFHPFPLGDALVRDWSVTNKSGERKKVWEPLTSAYKIVLCRMIYNIKMHALPRHSESKTTVSNNVTQFVFKLRLLRSRCSTKIHLLWFNPVITRTFWIFSMYIIPYIILKRKNE